MIGPFKSYKKEGIKAGIVIFPTLLDMKFLTPITLALLIAAPATVLASVSAGTDTAAKTAATGTDTAAKTAATGTDTAAKTAATGTDTAAKTAATGTDTAAKTGEQKTAEKKAADNKKAIDDKVVVMEKLTTAHGKETDEEKKKKITEDLKTATKELDGLKEGADEEDTDKIKKAKLAAAPITGENVDDEGEGMSFKSKAILIGAGCTVFVAFAVGGFFVYRSISKKGNAASNA